MRIYLAAGGEPFGPYSRQELDAMWQSGQVPDGALYWYQGMPAWGVAAQFQPPPRLVVKPESVILTTSPFLASREIESEVEIVTAECVFGMHIFKDLAAALSDAFGGRSKTTQNELRVARKTCLDELRGEAAALGADAVIAVDLDYSEISGQGKAMLLLVASGTAVNLRPVFPPLPGSAG